MVSADSGSVEYGRQIRSDFLQDFKTSFLAEEIYVYTPKGDVKMLPVGSTALDFAFAIHSAVG